MMSRREGGKEKYKLLFWARNKEETLSYRRGFEKYYSGKKLLKMAPILSQEVQIKTLSERNYFWDSI